MFHGGFSWSLWFSVKVIKCPYPCVNAETHQKKIYTKIKLTCELPNAGYKQSSVASVDTHCAFMQCVGILNCLSITRNNFQRSCVCVGFYYRSRSRTAITPIILLAFRLPLNSLPMNKKLPITVISLVMKSPYRSFG